MLIFERDIAIDVGTSTTLIYAQGKGIVLREPTVVAVDKHTGQLLKVGQEAQKMLGRTPANIVAIHPIRNGVISDYDMTVAMLTEFVKKVTSFSLFKPRMLVAVPGSITGVEELAMIDAIVEAGARKAYLSESSLATVVGTGVDISKPDGRLVIDIGSGKTDVAVISLNGVVESRSVKTAGYAFDEAIVRYIRSKHNVVIGMRTAEEVKRSIGGIVHLTLCLIQGSVITVKFTLHIVERRRSVIKLNLPLLCPAVIFSERLGGIGKSRTERFDFLLLCLDFLIQHLVSCREGFYGTVVLVKLRLHDLHFRAENLEGLIDFGQCLLEFFFALKTDF